MNDRSSKKQKLNNTSYRNKETNSCQIKKSVLMSRRQFVANTTLLGTGLFFSPLVMPSTSYQGSRLLKGKHKDLVILSDTPLNAEVPAHLLNDSVTPSSRLFIRNNGVPPEKIDADEWTLTIDGESIETPKVFSLRELKKKFKHYTYQLTIECGGNGRSEFVPSAKGIPWTTGAVGSPLWTGVRLKDVINDCGIKGDAVYIGYHGSDSHLSKDPNKEAISRGVPIQKALENESLIAWAINESDLPLANGFPLRLVFGGWPASVSGKWLNRISVRNKEHDGEKMQSPSYRTPCTPIAPGGTTQQGNMCIIEAMPVKSLITNPRSGLKHKLSQKLLLNGHAWVGDKAVSKVEVSINYGKTWQLAELTPPVNKNAWQHWNIELSFPNSGYYEIWSKATDSEGISQPMVLPEWNPRGYLNNACHRISIQVA